MAPSLFGIQAMPRVGLFKNVSQVSHHRHDSHDECQPREDIRPDRRRAAPGGGFLRLGIVVGQPGVAARIGRRRGGQADVHVGQRRVDGPRGDSGAAAAAAAGPGQGAQRRVRVVVAVVVAATSQAAGSSVRGGGLGGEGAL